ncbi:MAG TPA: pyruvate carboxylase [Planctomycetota bacterium]|nr:pyruvate carboxylase [Planctomycetota bacterium]
MTKRSSKKTTAAALSKGDAASPAFAHPASVYQTHLMDESAARAQGIRPIRKLLVANRSEIAIRVFRACNEMGIVTVGIYSEEDKLALHRYKCDEAYQVGVGKGPISAYLSMDEIVQLALDKGADAIHPGYGFLSENSEFASKVMGAGLIWVGPDPDVMVKVSDKVSARKLALSLGLPVIPGTPGPVESVEHALKFANKCGYPVMIKASHGGGGRGIRAVNSDAELREMLPLAQREALSAFGSDECFIEKRVLKPKHLEVQILGDKHGSVLHLFERDCSIQRRNQKVIEFAPSLALIAEQRERLCSMAVKFAKAAGYQNAGTVEFLMDPKSDEIYLIEMNTRIQVEHTVTEMVTGIDLVQAQIRIAEGYRLGDPQTRVPAQDQVELKGYAIQARITTENPAKSFTPDYGRITTYRSAAGFGIRLDGGTAYTGAVITPYYDSLLVKLTSHGSDFLEAAARLNRALSEFRIRGLASNIPFLQNVLRHPDFLAGRCDTGFIEANPDLFTWREPRDRANKLLNFLAEITVNGNPIVGEGLKAPAHALIPVAPVAQASRLHVSEDRAGGTLAPQIPSGSKQILEREGAEGLGKWARRQAKLLITDTTFRDAHQSLLATRMRSHDMLAIADFYARRCSNLFSMEMWGGATFDTAMRFLKECPWERLVALREKIPNILFQMLVRGSSAVGYTNYPDNVVREFIKESAQAGMDIFRIFDCLNWLPGLEVAIEAVLKTDRICEAAICYTADINDPSRPKYDLKYYVTMAKELVKRGTHIIGIKDMAGLCKPYAAEKLVKALRDEVGVPVHFHTHDTCGTQGAAILKAGEAGVDIADMAIASMSGLTSQPNLNAIVSQLKGGPRDTGLDIPSLNKIGDYFENVRKFYYPFESDMRAGTAEVYEHEMPGGQYTNLQQQAQSMGLDDRWEEVKREYRAVNFLFGDIVKVTPSSKVVGDMALFLVTNRLKSQDVIEKGKHLSFPESVVQFFEGHIGFPPGGFDPKLQAVILKDRKPLKKRAGALLPPVDLSDLRDSLAKKFGPDISRRDALSAALYDKVFNDFAAARKLYGDPAPIPTKNFLFGMDIDEEIKVEIEPGKTLIVKLISIAEPAKDGTRKVYFELNGMPREAVVRDKLAKTAAVVKRKAEPDNPHHVGAAMPGLIAEVKVSKGSEVKKNDVLMVLEAMKMQVNVAAPKDGVIREVPLKKGDIVEAGDLLAVFE